jgi:hypothetical protein
MQNQISDELSPASSATLSASNAPSAADASDAAFFQRHGYWVSPEPLFTADELTAAREAAQRFWAGEVDHPMPNGEVFNPWDGSPGLRKNDYASLTMDALWAVVSKPILGGTAACLGGHEGIRFWHDQLLLKPQADEWDGDDEHGDRARSVGWHTDRGYWKPCTSGDMLTAWVALEDVDPDMRPLMVIPGSQAWANPFDGNFFEADQAAQWRELVKDHADAEAVAIPLKAGQVSFHHCNVVHGSRENTGARARLGMAVHMQPSDNAFRELRRADGNVIHHNNDHFVRKTADGYPDYADPAWCPRLA